MQIFHRLGHVFGGSLLIAATAIGVGMLALPVATGPMGFGPSMLMYLVVWLFMLCTGLLMLEVCIWMPNDANFITMTHRLLGPIGQGLCWAFYLFLFGTIMIAHIVGAGRVMAEIMGETLPLWKSMILYVLVFSPLIYFGTKTIDRANILLMVGVIVLFLSFIFISAKHVQADLLHYADWGKAWLGLPVLLTAFTYQLIIPTLMTYMDRNVKKVRLSIILGSSVPLVVYILWEFLIMGIVPIQGENGLIAAAKQGYTAVQPLKEILGDSRIFKIGNLFAFFVFTTSYLTFSLAFLDFLADGLKIKKVGLRRVFLCLLIFVPATIISLMNPKIFLTMLHYAGGISVAVLFCLFPPLMVWTGRYVKKYELQKPQLFGGKIMLVFLISFVVVEVILEVKELFF